MITHMAASLALSAGGNATIYLGANNVHGEVPSPAVVLLGVTPTLPGCEALCCAQDGNATHPCRSFTWHHPDFPKPQYASRCYAHTDYAWAPVAQSQIDSGLRFALPPTPPPTPPGWVCAKDADCSGYNGACTAGACACRPGWAGATCGQVKFVAGSARKAFESDLWTWGASPIVDAASGAVHLFASQLSADCGILHYCSNSHVVHLVAPSGDALGPYETREIALPPSAPPAWDSGATHGVSVHALPRGVNASWPRYALFYMGTRNTWDPAHGTHPNCTAAYDANTGDRGSRRIGVATSDSLDGPWRRRDAPIFGPGNRSAGEWDFGDESNPTPIVNPDGSVVLLYKGRGGSTQAVGVATAPAFDGPFNRSKSHGQLGGEDPWGWIDPSSGTYHAFVHDGNGALSAGGHGWSVDGVTWTYTHIAYTGNVTWQNGSALVLARRERPQVLLARPNTTGGSTGVPEYLFTAAQDCLPKTDGGPGTAGCRTYTMVEQIDLS